MNQTQRMELRVWMLGLLVISIMVCAPSGFAQDRDSDTATSLGSTVPANGDVNPYGVARVPRTRGRLVEGRFLVSNFNNAANQQGTGTTIVQMQANGSMELFAQIDPSMVSCPGGVGLTTALVALRSGFVIVGSLPTTDGTAATAKAGCLFVLDSNGKVVKTISGHHINGPWDMTAVDGGDVFVLFVTNVLNGTVAGGGNIVNKGTVVRLLLVVDDRTPQLLDSSVIASGFPERTDPAALVIGPTGVAFDWKTGNLLVADSLDNRIAAIPNALFRTQQFVGKGRTVSLGGALNDPLGASLFGSNLYVANGNDGNIVQVNIKTGKQVDVDLVDSSGGPPPGAGALFGLWALGSEVYFVDDATNTFNLLH